MIRSSSRLLPIQIGGGVAIVVLLGVLWWRPWHVRAKAPSAPPPAATVHAAPADKPIEANIVSERVACAVAAEPARGHFCG